MEQKYFKAFIRVVKSINTDNMDNVFSSANIVEERLIVANDKDEVKRILLGKYPQFFPNNKVYSKETKDTAQFFYVVIFELYEWEKKIVVDNVGWKCDYCGHQHENIYVSRPRKNERQLGDKMFCKSDDDHCISMHEKEFHKYSQFPDDNSFITAESPIFIYKITEKKTGKCYIGKTRNAPIWRWWNHLTWSKSPFGLYLKGSKLSEWTFEVVEELPPNTLDADVFKIESQYILRYDSINNGFNSMISCKEAIK